MHRLIAILLALHAGGSHAPSAAIDTQARAAREVQEPAGDDFVRCIKCRNAGALPCEEHPHADDLLEENAVYCTLVAGCEACGGTGWIDCERCENPSVEQRLAKKRERQPALAEEVAKYPAEMGRPLRLAVSDHFLLVVEVDSFKVDKTKLGAHELLHLYLGRLETLFAEYVQLLGITDAEFRKRSRVMIWSDPADHAEAARRFCTNAGERGVKLMGEDPTYTVPAIKRFFTTDEQLHRNVVHHTVHLLLSHQNPSLWIGQIKGGWADEGLAHWFEDRFFKKCDNYCYQEVYTDTNLRSADWRPLVRKLVAEDGAPPLPELFEQNSESLTEDQHLVAFSLVDHLLQEDAGRTNALFRSLRAKAATRDALQAVFGRSVLELETSWKAWVLATYPVR